MIHYPCNESASFTLTLPRFLYRLIIIASATTASAAANTITNILFAPTGFSNLFILEMYNNYDENMYLEHRLYTNDILKLFNEYSDNIKMYIKSLPGINWFCSLKKIDEKLKN